MGTAYKGCYEQTQVFRNRQIWVHALSYLRNLGQITYIPLGLSFYLLHKVMRIL